jgi:hypothetical protein
MEIRANHRTSISMAPFIIHGPPSAVAATNIDPKHFGSVRSLFSLTNRLTSLEGAPRGFLISTTLERPVPPLPYAKHPTRPRKVINLSSYIISRQVKETIPALGATRNPLAEYHS